MKVRIIEAEEAEKNAAGDISHSVFVETLDGTPLAKYQAKETTVDGKGKETVITGAEAARRACKTNNWQIVKR